jgi:hypothetical protein
MSQALTPSGATVMQSKSSVHDNIVYAYVVNCEQRQLTLHTAYRDREPHEFTDLIFREVVAHFFENVLSNNILFDVEESGVASVVHAQAAIFKESWRWGWPPIEYNGDLAVLTATLQAQQVRAYSISSSYGLSGWILAGSYDQLSRSERARVA